MKAIVPMRAVGLPGIVDLGEAHTSARIAIGEMSDSERAEFRPARRGCDVRSAQMIVSAMQSSGCRLDVDLSAEQGNHGAQGRNSSRCRPVCGG
jgi:hypothetical protein